MFPKGIRGRGVGMGLERGEQGGSTQQWQNGGVGMDKGLHCASLIQSRLNSAGTIFRSLGVALQHSAKGVISGSTPFQLFQLKVTSTRTARGFLLWPEGHTCSLVPILVLICQVALEIISPALDCLLYSKYWGCIKWEIFYLFPWSLRESGPGREDIVNMNLAFTSLMNTCSFGGKKHLCSLKKKTQTVWL